MVKAIAGNARYETGSDSNAFTFSPISPLRDISPLLFVFAKMSARITHPRAKGGAVAEAAAAAHARSLFRSFSLQKNGFCVLLVLSKVPGEINDEPITQTRDTFSPSEFDARIRPFKKPSESAGAGGQRG